ncbi:alpha,alpha-trehalose-phosphate synthase [Parvularcula bermudensis HTCC2503]|uniref:Alpha,alpha-trehalose-phosphate synthase n=1 Tax=Parvularcula bermudensis (strain ATCC BAA-594 / HTCC2503 / KCTC 12087) TaxID=314260 RepID=E0TGW1_PARBH|nr:HAD family hydrolase [Parvularcula bermudensis]ADM10720.1 alpha,alpha-trehalose-phosphate synthase [Parvularcula bermudensis HTCC2503]
MTDLAGKSTILATDLDGTFLGGDDEQRRTLYDFVEANRDWLGLVFVTGRDLEFIKEITAADVPTPDLIIGDVGTTVVQGDGHAPVTAVEDWIDEKWTGADEIAALAKAQPFLRLQDVFGGRRLSYFYDDGDRAEELAEAIRGKGFDVIISDGIYFDVLPKGIQKGPTLERTLAHYDLPRDAVLVAGDTLNDLSLFHTGLDGVVVGNAEAKLKEAVQGLQNVYHSPHHGAGGVHDALHRKINA